jgi:acetylglutamate kinase
MAERTDEPRDVGCRAINTRHVVSLHVIVPQVGPAGEAPRRLPEVTGVTRLAGRVVDRLTMRGGCENRARMATDITLAQDALSKARVLTEALPWISRFAGKTFVVKYGGAAMKGGLREDFARDIVLLRYVGIHVIVVHGGGPQIDAMLLKLGIQPKKVAGMRVTDAATMEVVEMVLAGKINQDLCALFNRQGGKAVGLSGHDANFMKCDLMKGDQGEDLGLVGLPKIIEPALLKALQHDGFIPVIAPIGVDSDGRSLNVNADLVASAVASAVKAEKLVLLTDVAGVLNANGELMKSLDATETNAAIASGEIGGGMIPKVRCCLDAIDAGVGSAHIVDGRTPHTLLLEIFTDRGIGTHIRGR